MFMTIDVSRPAILFRKLGRPHANIFFTMEKENTGLTNESARRPFLNCRREIEAVIAIPRHDANAAAQIPKPKTPRNTSSTTAQNTERNMLRHMLVCIFPHILR